MRAIFMIPSRVPPTLREPATWSREFVHFLAQCLRKDYNQRPSAAQLLTHPFVSSASARLDAAGGKSAVLRELVDRCLPLIEELRREEEAEEQAAIAAAEAAASAAAAMAAAGAGAPVKTAAAVAVATPAVTAAATVAAAPSAGRAAAVDSGTMVITQPAPATSAPAAAIAPAVPAVATASSTGTMVRRPVAPSGYGTLRPGGGRGGVGVGGTLQQRSLRAGIYGTVRRQPIVKSQVAVIGGSGQPPAPAGPAAGGVGAGPAAADSSYASAVKQGSPPQGMSAGSNSAGGVHPTATSVAPNRSQHHSGLVTGGATHTHGSNTIAAFREPMSDDDDDEDGDVGGYDVKGDTQSEGGDSRPRSSGSRGSGRRGNGRKGASASTSSDAYASGTMVQHRALTTPPPAAVNSSGHPPSAVVVDGAGVYRYASGTMVTHKPTHNAAGGVACPTATAGKPPRVYDFGTLTAHRSPPPTHSAGGAATADITDTTTDDVIEAGGSTGEAVPAFLHAQHIRSQNNGGSSSSAGERARSDSSGSAVNPSCSSSSSAADQPTSSYLAALRSTAAMGGKGWGKALAASAVTPPPQSPVDTSTGSGKHASSSLAAWPDFRAGGGGGTPTGAAAGNSAHSTAYDVVRCYYYENIAYYSRGYQKKYKTGNNRFCDTSSNRSAGRGPARVARHRGSQQAAAGAGGAVSQGRSSSDQQIRGRSTGH